MAEGAELRLIITPILVLSAIKASSCRAGRDQRTDRAGLQWGNNWAIYILKRRRRKRGREGGRETGTNDHHQSYGNTRARVLQVGNGAASSTALSVRHLRRLNKSPKVSQTLSHSHIIQSRRSSLL